MVRARASEKRKESDTHTHVWILIMPSLYLYSVESHMGEGRRILPSTWMCFFSFSFHPSLSRSLFLNFACHFLFFLHWKTLSEFMEAEHPICYIPVNSPNSKLRSSVLRRNRTMPNRKILNASPCALFTFIKVFVDDMSEETNVLLKLNNK